MDNHYSTNSGNTRIAKNTLFLYARLLLLLVINLYASRVILNALGVDDYGIYNVVGGIVVMFSFVNGALTTGTQRHISFELGKENGDVPKIFTACLKVHALFGFVILLFAETIGLWFVNTQMNFPEGRLYSVNWVYQFAILTSIVSVLRTPYEASVIAYEKMSFYAYMGIFEAILKLAVVFMLKILVIDKLIAFSGLQFMVSIIAVIVFISYSHSRLPGFHITRIKDKGLYRYLVSFSGWTLFGSLATLLETQGLNIIINIYWGVALNAAVGIANQIRSAIAQFVGGFQQALNPQLVMTQSTGNRERQYDLIFKSSKFSFLIMFLGALPVCVNLPYILKIWLNVVPEYTAQICYLVIFVQMIECLASPLFTTIFAVGNIKNYQITVGMLRCGSLLLGFVLCYLRVAPYLVFIAPCLFSILLLTYRLLYVRKSISLSIRAFFKNTLLPLIVVVISSAIPIILYKLFIPFHESFVNLLIETLIILLWVGIVVFCFGLTFSERKWVMGIILKKIKTLNNEK